MDKLVSLDFGLTFWTLLNFALLVAVLGKFAWKPVLKALEEREANMKKEREALEAARAQAQKSLEDVQARLSQIAQESKAAIAAAINEGRKEKEAIMESAQAEAKAVAANAKRELEAEKQRLVAELRRDVVGLSLMAAEKLIEKNIDADAGRKAVEEMLGQLKRQ